MCFSVIFVVYVRSVRAKHFLIHEDGIVKLSGLRSVVCMIEDGARVKVYFLHEDYLWGRMERDEVICL